MKPTPYKFFFENAGYSYNAKTETELDGKRKCARALTIAERVFLDVEDENLFYDIREDFDDCVLGDGETVEMYENGDLIMVTCAIMQRMETGKLRCLASLSGVSVKSIHDNYLRVVRAELASECEDLLREIKKTK